MKKARAQGAGEAGDQQNDRGLIATPAPSAQHSSPEIKDEDLGCTVQPKLVEHVRAGQEAWARLTNCQSWNDWLLVGEALLIGRSECMRTAHANKPEGRRYNEEFSDWLKANKFDGIDKSTRSRLFECLAHRAQIEAWLVTLATNDRLKKLNHPAVVLRNWQKTQVKKPDNAKLSPVAKLKETIVKLEEENYRLVNDSKHNAPFTPQDRPRDIAGYIWRTIQQTPRLARSIARDLTELARQAEQTDTPTRNERQRGANVVDVPPLAAAMRHAVHQAALAERKR